MTFPTSPMTFSVVIPAHNEEEGVRPTVERLYGALMAAQIPGEILVVNDHSTDQTEAVLARLARELPGVRYVNNPKPAGFGFALQTGLERFRGDAVCIVMADASDDPQDVIAYYRALAAGYECVFGSRFVRGSRVVDYPLHKLLVNRLANQFIDVLFRLRFNDTTNAFKAYRREVIEGVKPLLSSHFNITVELPLKAITRGYTYTSVPINWYNRATGVSKLKIKEMGSRYLFIVLYVWLEQLLSRGDYRRKAAEQASAEISAAQMSAAAPRDAQDAQDAHDAQDAQDAHDALMEQTLRRPVAMVGGASVGLAPTAVAEAAPLAPTPSIPSIPSTPLAPPMASAPPPPSTWSRGLTALGGALCVLPLLLVGFILAMIWTHTPHVPYWDEWETVTLVQHATQGTLTWNDFWAFHNEHRIVLPRLLDLGLIQLTHWNRQIEMSFDLLLAVAEWGLLVVSVSRGLRSKAHGKALTALAAAPIGLAVFSLGQWENWLWSFQITFILTVFGVALCVFGLTWTRAGTPHGGTGHARSERNERNDRSERIGWLAFGVVVVGAVVAALSSLGGLAVFVAFLPAVFVQGYRKTVVWLLVAAGIIVPYLRGFPHSTPFSLSLTTLKFVVAYLGAPAGAPSAKVAFALGGLSLALAVVNVGYYWLRERRLTRGLTRGLTPLWPWIGLGGYAIGLALITSQGRLDLGLWSQIALTSRYQAFSALWWVAVIYLQLLNLSSALAHRKELAQAAPQARLDGLDAGLDAGLDTRLKPWLPWLIGANLALLLLGSVGLVATSVRNLSAMETFQETQRQTEGCVVNVEYADVPCLWRFYPAPNELPPLVAVLRDQRDTIFAGDYQRLEQPAPVPAVHALVRYYDPTTGDYLVTTRYDLNAYGPYYDPTVLGYVYDQQQPGTRALYSCVTADGQHFVSLKATCVGGTVSGTPVRMEGWLLTKPSTASGAAGSGTAGASADTPLFECRSASAADYVATQPTCEGQTSAGTSTGTRVGTLGYALAAQP